MARIRNDRGSDRSHSKPADTDAVHPSGRAPLRRAVKLLLPDGAVKLVVHSDTPTILGVPAAEEAALHALGEVKPALAPAGNTVDTPPNRNESGTASLPIVRSAHQTQLGIGLTESEQKILNEGFSALGGPDHCAVPVDKVTDESAETNLSQDGVNTLSSRETGTREVRMEVIKPDPSIDAQGRVPFAASSADRNVAYPKTSQQSFTESDILDPSRDTASYPAIGGTSRSRIAFVLLGITALGVGSAVVALHYYNKQQTQVAKPPVTLVTPPRPTPINWSRDSGL